MSEVPDEIKDEYASKARVLWASLRENDFHDGRNKIAALLRADAAESLAREAGMREALQVGVDAILSQTSVACVIHREGDNPCEECGQCQRVKARRVMVAALYSPPTDALARFKAEVERPWREALGMMYDKWENGTQCFEACGDIIEDGSPIGNAFQLNDDENQKVMDLLDEKINPSTVPASEPKPCEGIKKGLRCSPCVDAKRTCQPDGVITPAADTAKPKEGA